MPAVGDHVKVTPEGVPLAVEVAGLGSRMISLLLDLLIQGLLLLVLAALFAAAGWTTASAVTFVVVTFAVMWGYFALFEGLWNGQTPGKRAQRLRVVMADGQPVTMAAVLVRNILRIVDYLPGTFAVGAMSILLSRTAQRVGDMAAGTIVVREFALHQPATVPLPANGRGAANAPLVDTAAVTEGQYEVARAFLDRRATMQVPARAALAVEIAASLRHAVGGEARVPDPERFLEAVVVSYRASRSPRPPAT